MYWKEMITEFYIASRSYNRKSEKRLEVLIRPILVVIQIAFCREDGKTGISCLPPSRLTGKNRPGKFLDNAAKFIEHCYPAPSIAWPIAILTRDACCESLWTHMVFPSFLIFWISITGSKEIDFGEIRFSNWKSFTI
jgi:hypothetical protein